MTTAQDVFNIAMSLMDELNESTGSPDSADTKEYKNRTLSILNVLRGELFPYSDTYAQTVPGKRPICPLIVDFVTPIGLDDAICQTVMPYGLSAHLLLDENPGAAAYFAQRYEELIAVLGRGIPSEFEPIEDVYGGFGSYSGGRW